MNPRWRFQCNNRSNRSHTKEQPQSGVETSQNHIVLQLDPPPSSRRDFSHETRPRQGGQTCFAFANRQLINSESAPPEDATESEAAVSLNEWNPPWEP
ncbi:MAG: hypothetical protein CMN75_02790 [Spirochaeta sp.]|nr:hypothetical protein [Spirochaeta sp.]